MSTLHPETRRLIKSFLKDEPMIYFIYHESNPIKEEDSVYPPSFSDLFWTKYPALTRI